LGYAGRPGQDRPLLSGAVGDARCQVGYIACADDDTRSTQLHGIRPTIVRYDPDYAAANARPDPDAPLFDVAEVDAEDAEMVEVEAVVVDPPAANEEDIF
jgi:hypothetical protein